MKKLFLTQLVLIGILTLTFGVSALGQVIPTNLSTAFYDDATTFNGAPVPVGSIITAYDQSGVLCGMYTVHTAGEYGFMPVYGDDTTPGSTVDEGADPGEAIVFEINGRPATVEAGDNTFTNQAQKQVQLSASSAVAITAVDMPADKAGSFDTVVRFLVGVRNDGDGTDFYGVTADNANAEFTTLPQADTIYADPGETVYVPFDIQTPLWPGDTTDVIDFTVYSIIDPTAEISGTVTLYFSITDVGDEKDELLPGSFALHQNYPNPFNPTTTIAFALPSSSNVNLRIYDVLGRVVDTRELGALPAGDHQIEYDATNLPSGIYFYRLDTDTADLTRKMVLVK